MQWELSKLHDSDSNEAPNTEGDRTQTEQLLSPKKVLALGLDFIQMRCWPKGFHVNAQTTQDYGYWPELSLRYSEYGTNILLAHGLQG